MRGWVVALLAAVLLVVVAGLGLIAIVVAGDDTTAIVDLETGDCFGLPDEAASGSFDGVHVVDCGEPHDAEVVRVGDLNGTGDQPYPSDDALFSLVEDACRGVLPNDQFGMLPVAPTEAVWDSFDGRYLCVAVPFGGGTVTGSIVAG